MIDIAENSHIFIYISLKAHIPSPTQVSVGAFSAGGNFSHANGSKDSKSTFDASSKSLKIHGAQIIGWVCVVNPLFPHVDSK